MHMIDRAAFAADAELEALQGRDPAQVYADPAVIAQAERTTQMQRDIIARCAEINASRRPKPRPCGICDGDHSTIICQMSGAAPRPRPKLSLFKR